MKFQVLCLTVTTLLAAALAAPSNDAAEAALINDLQQKASAANLSHVILPLFNMDGGSSDGMKLKREIEADLMDSMWKLFKLLFQRSYSGLEETRRKVLFEERVKMIVAHNIQYQLGLQSFDMTINNLIDRTEAEQAMLRGYRHPSQRDEINGRHKRQALMPTYYYTINVNSLPATVNWTAKGWVGPVLNQGSCGSCWAFSAAEALSSQYYNISGTYVELSEQNLIDCTGYLGNNGCAGGCYQYAFEYAENGIDSAASYPYTGMNGTCAYNPSNSVTKDVGWWNIERNSEFALQQAVALVGPVSVAIDAGLPSFQYYKSGVYAPAGCTWVNIDHAVLAVGYGTTSNGQAYWLLENSWGTSWGMNGYMMMARNDGNMCGIAYEPAVPIIN